MTAVAAHRTPALSPEQQAAADHLLSRVEAEHVQTLGGYAGCGKTVTLAHLAAALPDFLVVAFTGKAADILRRKGLPASTIHGAIYRPRDTLKGVRFDLKSAEELGGRGFLVDEASMVGADVFRDLKSFGLPIIAVGDHGQLPPVGEDAGLMRDPDVRLETIHRNAGPIARFAEHVRTGGAARDWFARRGNTPAVYGAERGRVGSSTLLAADQILCAYNRTRVGLNRTVRAELGRPSDAPHPGDRVMCLRNSKDAEVFNGQQGTVGAVDPGERRILFRPAYGEESWVNYHPGGWLAEKTPPFKPGTNPAADIPFDYAWAVTVHKAQGDEWGKVVVYEERCDRLWEHSRWAYTAASRAKESLIWVLD